MWGNAQTEKNPKYLVLKGQKNFAPPMAPRHNTYLPSFFAVYCSFKKQFFEKKTRKFHKPYIPKF